MFDSKPETHEDKLRNYVKKFLIVNKFVSSEENSNIIDMQKAFIAGSVVSYAISARKKQKIDDKQLNLYFRALSDFKLGKINLFWDEGQIRFSIVEQPIIDDEGEEYENFEIISEEENNDPPEAA